MDDRKAMDRTEIYKELQMTYDELQQYLIEKYGGAVCAYFATPECKSKSKKISRTGEGLYCHHMDEDKGGNLSDPVGAINQPFEWQKKERLVYCNVLEHLILHIKIAVLRQKDVLENLVNDIVNKDYHFDTGCTGVKFVLPVLYDNGYSQVAYKVLTQKTYPSWCFWLEQGATSAWESWELVILKAVFQSETDLSSGTISYTLLPFSL